MTRITGVKTFDLRFPTSGSLDGSDAMNPDPDYSAAYLVLETDGGHQGHGLTFTTGRGNEICVAAIEALSALVVGLDLDWITEDMGRFWRHVTGDSQLRWIGPDKGAIHLATGAVVNSAHLDEARAHLAEARAIFVDGSDDQTQRCDDLLAEVDAAQAT